MYGLVSFPPSCLDSHSALGNVTITAACTMSAALTSLEGRALAGDQCLHSTDVQIELPRHTSQSVADMPISTLPGVPPTPGCIAGTSVLKPGMGTGTWMTSPAPFLSCLTPTAVLL